MISELLLAFSPVILFGIVCTVLALMATAAAREGRAQAGELPPGAKK